jgi:hypothetical protein
MSCLPLRSKAAEPVMPVKKRRYFLNLRRGVLDAPHARGMTREI